MARFTLAGLALIALMTSGCVSGSGGRDVDATTSASASPKRYEDDPDKKKQVCESTMEGNEPKTVCY